jgi:hypothetical protein
MALAISLRGCSWMLIWVIDVSPVVQLSVVLLIAVLVLAIGHWMVFHTPKVQPQAVPLI